MPCNGEKMQLYEAADLAPKEEQAVWGHLVISTEEAEIPGMFTSVYTVSDGNNSIRVTVNFVYDIRDKN